MEAYEITSVACDPNIGSTPARVNYITGALYINPNIWPSLSKERKQAIVSHELGHVAWKTKNEFEADNFAFVDYKKKGLSTKEFVKTYSNILDIDNLDHRDRFKNVLKNAIIHDYNLGHTDVLEKLINSIKKSNMGRTVDMFYETGFDGDGNVVDFGKAFQNRLNKKLARAKVNQEIGQMKDTYGARGRARTRRDSLDNKNNAKADKWRGQAEAEVTLANQGIQKKSATAGVFSEIAGAVKGVFGKSGEEVQQDDEMSQTMEAVAPVSNKRMGILPGEMPVPGSTTPVDTKQPTNNADTKDDKKKDNTIMWVGIAIGGAIVLGVIAYFTSKK